MSYLTNLLKNSFLSRCFIIHLKISTWILVICAKIAPNWKNFIFDIFDFWTNALVLKENVFLLGIFLKRKIDSYELILGINIRNKYYELIEAKMSRTVRTPL